MGIAGRPTLRCLSEDLVAGWDDPDVGRGIANGALPREPLELLPHPFVRYVAAQFAKDESDDVRRENIGGLSHPMFWKAKSGRWRGAVYEDPDGVPWLCAAGFREAGSRDDFYVAFTADIRANGADRYLPTELDGVRLRLEQAAEAIREWRTEVGLRVLRTVAAVVDMGEEIGSSELELSGPSGARIGQLAVTLSRLVAEHRSREGEALLEIHILIRDHSDSEALAVLVQTVCAAISPHEDDWDAVPMQGQLLNVATVSEARLHDIVVAVEFEDFPVGPPSAVEPTAHSHYVPAPDIARGLILGEAVMAVCGRCFVPRRDPARVPLCPSCEEIREQRTVRETE